MGRIEISEKEELLRVLEEASARKYEFLSCRIRCDQLPLAQALEAQGFYLTDTLIYYKKEAPVPYEMPINEWRMVSEDPRLIPEIVEVAEKAFKNYPSHFRFDPRLDVEATDAVYPDWARKCCENREVANEVLAYVLDGVVAGTIALKIKGDEADVLLAAVHPDHQNKGILRRLLRAAGNWSNQRECARVIYSTQLLNMAPQKALIREGWEICRAYYTFHSWLSPERKR